MNIIVTGASRGIGFETVQELAQGKGNRILALSRNQEALRALRTGREDCIEIMAFDLARPDDAALEARLLEIGFAQVDVLLNNAGLLLKGSFAEMDPDQWRETFEVNVFGPVALIRKLLPRLQAAPSAHVLNIGSMGGFQGSAKFPGLAAYSASKAALATMTECLAEEMKETTVRANCLCLGAVDTEMLRTAFPGFEAPLSSAEMGRFVADFCMNGQRFFNGKVLPVSVGTP